MNGEEESVRRVFSKTFKLDENNQYGFAMTKPLPIGIFVKKSDINLIEMNNAYYSKNKEKISRCMLTTYSF